MADKINVKRTTPKFRLSFPHLDQPDGMEGQEKKYSVVMLFPKDSDMKWAKEAIAEVLNAKFGSKEKWPKGWKNPIRDGDNKESPIAGYEGSYYMTARSKDKPGVVDAKCQDVIDVRTEVYAGCYCRATIAFYYYDKSGNKGVGIALNNVQKLADGEAFSGKASAKKDFADSVSDEAAASSDDDLI